MARKNSLKDLRIYPSGQRDAGHSQDSRSGKSSGGDAEKLQLSSDGPTEARLRRLQPLVNKLFSPFGSLDLRDSDLARQ